MTHGPLLRGASTVIYEGKPHMPDPGIMWKLCQQYSVGCMFMAPTVIRLLKKEDNDGSFIKKYFPSNLRTITAAGERFDPDSVLWMRKQLPHIMINDTWW